MCTVRNASAVRVAGERVGVRGVAVVCVCVCVMCACVSCLLDYAMAMSLS